MTVEKLLITIDYLAAITLWNCCEIHFANKSKPDLQLKQIFNERGTDLQRHFTQSRIRRVHVCLAVACHLHRWPNERDLLRAPAVTGGRKVYRKKSAHMVNPGDENHPAAPAGTTARDLSITTPVLCH